MKFYNALIEDFLSNDELEEDIEKHNSLNQKLFNGEELKPEVADKVNQIVDLFLSDLKEDGIKIDVNDIILVGSNVSYNYTKDSDLDIHIIADTKNLHCPDDLYPLLYGAYKSLFNKKMNIDFYGIPVEIYVETSDTPLRSNGIYSVKDNKWIKFPKQVDIPDIDKDELEELVKPFEDRYNKIIANPTSDAIDKWITDIYEERQLGMARDGEYDLSNLVFKECRNRGYLDKLKDLKNETLSKELSLESMQAEVDESIVQPQDLEPLRQKLKHAVHNEVILRRDGSFFVYLVKENDVNNNLRALSQLDFVDRATASPSGKYDFAHMDFIKKLPKQYYTIRGNLK